MQPDVQDHRFQEMAQARSPLLHLRIFHFLPEGFLLYHRSQDWSCCWKAVCRSETQRRYSKAFSFPDWILCLLPFPVPEIKVLYKALFQSSQGFLFCIEQSVCFLIFLLSLYVQPWNSFPFCGNMSTCIRMHFSDAYGNIIKNKFLSVLQNASIL